MATDGTALPGSDVRDRKSALIGNGIIEVLAGVFLFVPPFVSAPTPPNARMTILVPIISGAVAILFICCGLGSILCRRWGRALSLVLCWLWLIAGTHLALFMWYFLSRRPKSTDSLSDMDTAFTVSTVIITSMSCVSHTGHAGAFLQQ